MTGEEGPGGEIFFDVRYLQSMGATTPHAFYVSDERIFTVASRISSLKTVLRLLRSQHSLIAVNTLPTEFLAQ